MITTKELKEKLIDGLNLEDLSPEDIDDNAGLFNEGLGLDSVDAIELIIILDNAYGIQFEEMSNFKNIFSTPKVLTDYINKHLEKQ